MYILTLCIFGGGITIIHGDRDGRRCESTVCVAPPSQAATAPQNHPLLMYPLHWVGVPQYPLRLTPRGQLKQIDHALFAQRGNDGHGRLERYVVAHGKLSKSGGFWKGNILLGT